MIVFSEDTAIIADIKAKLRARIKLINLSIAKFFLEIKILRD